MPQDITNQRFGKLVAVRETGADHKGDRVWEYRCDCGGTVEAPITRVGPTKRQTCGKCKNITHEGRSMSLLDWAKEYGINPATLRMRLARGGMSFEEAISAPIQGSEATKGQLEKERREVRSKLSSNPVFAARMAKVQQRRGF